MFNLSNEQEMLVSSLEELAEREFADDAFEWNGEVPWDNIATLAEHGFLGINFPMEYGGGGMTEFDAMLSVEAVGRVCPDTAEYLFTQQMVGPREIEMFGTEADKERYLPPMIEGEKDSAVAVAISEPEAGSDVGAMNTRAEEDGDDLIVNGEKIWVSNVPHSAAAVTWVKFPEGLGSLIIDFDAEGIEVAQHYTNMAEHTQTQFYMNDVRVPKENVLTRGKEGFKQQLKALNWERMGSVTFANSMARCALDKAIEYAGQREQFDQPIGDFQGIEWKLADMAKELEASRALAYRAAIDAHNRGEAPDRLQTSLAKLYSSEMVEKVVTEALQIHGANGYQQGHPLEYLYRLARGRRLAAGTDEIQKTQIADALKKDGVPSLL